MKSHPTIKGTVNVSRKFLLPQWKDNGPAGMDPTRAPKLMSDAISATWFSVNGSIPPNTDEPADLNTGTAGDDQLPTQPVAIDTNEAAKQTYVLNVLTRYVNLVIIITIVYESLYK